MNILFFFNWTQEDEGSEIIYFPAVSIYEKILDNEKRYFHEAAYFVQSLESVELAKRILQVIDFYLKENMLLKVEGKSWNNVSFVIENNYIMFKLTKTKDYTDKIQLESLAKVIYRWINYLQDVNKQEIKFEV